jgi:hypothetical protein
MPDSPEFTSVARDDRVLLANRVAHALLVIAVFPFFVGLTFFPQHTDKNFAWPLTPTMSAMLFGSLYLAVVFSFTRLVFARKWHHVAMVMWATLPVLTLLGLVTIVHWEKFTGPLPAFAVWFAAYVCLPPVLAALLYFNGLRDPKIPDPIDVEIPASIRGSTTVLGVVFLVVGIALFFFPTQMIEVWPWAMKPLAAQAIGSLFMAPAIVHIIAIFEARWSALRIVSQAAIIWFTAILVGVARAWGEFDTSRWLTWPFVIMLALEWVFAVLTYVSLERERLRRAEAAAG